MGERLRDKERERDADERVEGKVMNRQEKKGW